MFKIKSIQTKLILTFILLITIPMVVLGGVTYYITFNSLETIIEGQAAEHAKTTAEAVETDLNFVEIYLKSLSTNEGLIKAIELRNENTEEEDDLLDKAWGLEPDSRLSCQTIVGERDLVIELPKYTINMVSENH